MAWRSSSAPEGHLLWHEGVSNANTQNSCFYPLSIYEVVFVDFWTDDTQERLDYPGLRPVPGLEDGDLFLGVLHLGPQCRGFLSHELFLPL